ncbi:MAG: sn-glycerol-3-phosphate ABC transporter ATP-binding protein UgpC [Nitrospinota bacterium]|nr:MAG: sn-glycerol-3-phosphate ABC transporter ATP-binding protein UgpC [Nitrospinota bacterium]
MAQVTLQNLTKRFDKVVAVNRINLEIQDKEFVVLVGPSGCGKTTTLRMIAGLEEITDGTILIGDRVVNDVPPKDRNIAMVFQNYALYPHMNVYKNMAFGLKLRKTPKDEIDRRVKRAAQILGISDLLDRKPKQLSGGQRQRVAVGRAIVREPEVFLFDEPLSNLDAKLRVQMRSELIKLHDQLEATMIYVTHDQVEAMTMGDRIVVMKDGFIQQVGSPMEVYNHPTNQFVAGFIGSPAMNFFPGKLIAENNALWVDLKDFRIKIPEKRTHLYEHYRDKAVVFGVRPEDIYLRPPTEKGREFQTVEAEIEVVEPLGAEIIIELARGDHTFVARVEPQTEAKSGNRVTAYFDMSRFHLFDADTERNIVQP